MEIGILMKKIFKKGTVVLLRASCSYAGCDSEEEYVLPYDMTRKELNELAQEQAEETFQVEGWFVITDGENNEEKTF